MSGQIRITIENTDDFFYPRHSCLLVEGDLVEAAAGEVAGNVIMYLFANSKCSLGGHVGIGKTILGLCTGT